MKQENELKNKIHEILEFYNKLEYKEQKVVITALARTLKKAPYYITFKLDQRGLFNMTKVISYCQKYDIPYTPEKIGSKRVRFAFKDLSERNEALIGRLTL